MMVLYFYLIDFQTHVNSQIHKEPYINEQKHAINFLVDTRVIHDILED